MLPIEPSLLSDLLRLGFLLLLPVAIRVLMSARRRAGDTRDAATDGDR